MDDVLRPVFQIFEAELRDQAPSVADALIKCAEPMEAGERRELISSVYRYAHSMKGNAGTLGLPRLQELAHAMEQVLVPYRSGERALEVEYAKALLRALDLGPACVAAALAGSEGEDGEAARAAQQMTAELGRLVAPDGAGPSPTATAPANASAATTAIGDATAPRVAPASAHAADRARASAASPSHADAADRTRASAASSTHAASSSHAAADTLRVSVERLHRLDRVLDDLRDARGALDARVEDVRRIYWLVEEAVGATGFDQAPEPLRHARDKLRELARGFGLDLAEMSARMSDADEELRHLRMVPVETAIATLPRSVWEHAQRVGKQARLVTRGVDVALDRRLLEELKDPLGHLVRNAVDHGLEAPEARARAKKPAEGQITLEVEQKGARVLLTLSDDGAGVNAEAVRRQAVKRGLLTAEAAATLNEAGIHELLFAPGFSTATEVSLTSGRGVGLDVVRDRLSKVGGRVRVESSPGRGTRFVLDLPLTLATAQALLVEAGGHALALPLSAIHSSQYIALRGAAAPSHLNVEGQPLPIDSLARLLGLAERDSLRSGFAVVVLRVGDRLLPVAVDRLMGERDVVLKPLPPELLRLGHLTAAASLGDGGVVFVLQPRALGELSGARGRPERARTEGAAPRRRRVLVADDSITTRSLHRQVLEAAGYEVDTASDGEDALRLLGARAFDLVVSDVRMPRLDGVGLTERIRGDERWRALPVVLVSSLDTEEDRRRGREAGASALVSKSQYERGELLELVRSLLP